MASTNKIKKQFAPYRERIHEIIFEADTKAGKRFDIVLLVAILLSVVVVMIESIPRGSPQLHTFLYVFEWILTIFFTIEYALRLYSVYSPRKYALSFFGIIDLLAIVPTYLSIFFVGSQSLVVIRTLRLLRVFRILKLAKYMRHGRVLMLAVRQSIPKIAIFIFFVLVLVTIFGSIMYLVEGSSNTQFDSIPRSVYWAIVTLTTVGYGDISPQTDFGQLISACVMLLGYAVIAVPTGIVSVELIRQNERHNTQSCRFCSREGHDDDAEFCKYCGKLLNEEWNR